MLISLRVRNKYLLSVLLQPVPDPVVLATAPSGCQIPHLS